jgi:hypothetical protein
MHPCSAVARLSLSCGPDAYTDLSLAVNFSVRSLTAAGLSILHSLDLLLAGSSIHPLHPHLQRAASQKNVKDGPNVNRLRLIQCLCSGCGFRHSSSGSCICRNHLPGPSHHTSGHDNLLQRTHTDGKHGIFYVVPCAARRSSMCLCQLLVCVQQRRHQLHSCRSCTGDVQACLHLYACLYMQHHGRHNRHVLECAVLLRRSMQQA